ncbi:uncharacterized protein YecT (DUF1311 family) [Azomonas agilis]|uniref:Uncharacterized protein YecT (DUF1311 family) n=1 Tax=Azomonas agilis TaxID=116849 RepID=A0A562J314_9GAMM|nr:lysozyme inhibitor LprI family protein [Azomonas agilis]TWH77204.1 uncharacterized protein YecT (DUF1311 family) [Azomonas agilis]
MLLKVRAASLSILLSVSLSVSAFEDEDYSSAYNQCMDKADGVTIPMVECAMAEFQRQDTLLNQNYKAALKTLAPEKQKQLREIQRLWIQFRDAECSFYGNLTGGSIDRITSSSCMMEITKARADDLGALAESQESN